LKLIRKDVLFLAVPIMTEQVFIMSMGMINTMMAGHIGKEAVSAIGMVDSINNIFISLFSSLAVGGTVIVAQFVGQRNYVKANDTMKQSIYSGFLLSLIITILTWILKDPLISLLFGSAEPLIKQNAISYLGITLLTYPLISLDLVANGIMRGSGDTKTPMKITILMNIINVVMTYLFIHGININLIVHIHFHGMGIIGAALGIAIARIAGALIILYILLRGTDILKLIDLCSFKFDKQLLKPVLAIGIPASMEALLFNCGKLITQIYIVDMGTIAIAANAVTNSVAMTLNIPGNAMCTAATAIVGQSMGRDDCKGARSSLLYVTLLSSACLTLLYTLAAPFAPLIFSLYTKNHHIISLSTNILRVNALWIFIWPFSFVLSSGLKGAGDAKYTLVTTIIGMWVFRITFGYILGVSLKFGLMGVWLGMYTDWLVRGTLYLLRFKSGKWQHHNLIGNISKSA
jgi:putative MATE family efflux protein